MNRDTERARLATQLYIELATSASATEALRDGQEPGDYHERCARRAIAASWTFFDTLDAQVAAMRGDDAVSYSPSASAVEYGQ